MYKQSGVTPDSHPHLQISPPPPYSLLFSVLVVLIVPISMEIPTRVASWCFSASLALNAVLLLRLLFAMGRLGTNTRSGLSRQACATLLTPLLTNLFTHYSPTTLLTQIYSSTH